MEKTTSDPQSGVITLPSGMVEVPPTAKIVEKILDRGSRMSRHFRPRNLETMIFIAVFALWLIAILTFLGLTSMEFISISDLAQFGDSFGLINTLFSGLAFGAVIVTLIQQQKQSHEDRHLTSQQMFEAAFFEVNRIAREAKAFIRLTRPGEVYLGVDAANHLRGLFVLAMDSRHKDWNRVLFVDPKEEGKRSIWHGTIFSKEDIQEAFEGSINRQAIIWEFYGFFALISAELKFLETRPLAGLRDKDSEVYNRLLEVVRASLDSSTLAIMLLRGIGNEDTMEMIDKYDLAKHMNKGEVWKLCKPHYSSLRGVKEEA